MSEVKHTVGPWEVRYGNVSDADQGFGIVSKLDVSAGIVAECWPAIADDLKFRQMSPLLRRTPSDRDRRTGRSRLALERQNRRIVRRIGGV